MQRRSLLTRASAILSLSFLGRSLDLAAATRTPDDIRRLQDNWRASMPTDHEFVSVSPRLERDKNAWRERLPDDAYRVLFEEDTERPFSSALNDEKRDGAYACRACGLVLFTSAMKYDSGTGWPSFFTAITDHLGQSTDFKLIWPRTEYHCAKCGGHQGHVFDDGPAPTGQRWCNNGVALRFIPKQAR